MTQREITELTGARRADQLPRVLRLLAARTAGELVISHIHADAGLGSRGTSDGRVLAVEVKASATVERSDFRWLELLRAKLGDDFVHGYVLYYGGRPLGFGDRLSAVPLSYVWEAS